MDANVFLNPADRTLVIQQLGALNVHPEERQRLADLGGCPETDGQVLVQAIQQGRVAGWLTQDLDEPAYLTTDSTNPRATALESQIAATIGDGMPSSYNQLFIGGTIADAPLGLNVIHVKCDFRGHEVSSRRTAHFNRWQDCPSPRSVLQRH